MEGKNVEIETTTDVKTFLSTKRLPKTIIVIVVIALVLIAGVVAIVLVSQNKEGQVTTISESSLQKVIEINELSTIEYTYNAIAKNTNDKGEPTYYVAYQGTVVAGINFQEIDIDIVEEEKLITITLPAVEIHSTSVDMGTMEYIFTNDKYETETISHEAYKLCEADLAERIKNENLLYDTAKENAIVSVEALFKPWIESVDDEYKVEVK